MTLSSDPRSAVRMAGNAPPEPVPRPGLVRFPLRLSGHRRAVGRAGIPAGWRA